MKFDGICAVIPARSGSKSIPDKNIQLLAGLPLIAHCISTAKSVPEINRIIVSTDSKLYQTMAIKYGADVPFLRPDSISKDDSCDAEWVNHLLQWLIMEGKTLPKYLIHLRPTSPLRKPEYVNRAIQYIEQRPDATALRSVVEMAQSAYKHFEIDGDYLKIVGSGSFNLDEANLPRHFYTTTYDANGYVDILKTSHILETGKIHGNRVLPFLVPRITDIDSMEDLEYARYEAEK